MENVATQRDVVVFCDLHAGFGVVVDEKVDVVEGYGESDPEVAFLIGQEAELALYPWRVLDGVEEGSADLLRRKSIVKTKEMENTMAIM